MKKLSLYILVSGFFAVSATQSEKDCRKVATVKLGDRFSTLDKGTIAKEVEKECVKIGCSNYSIDIVKSNHPKLGPSYYAYGELFKCR